MRSVPSWKAVDELPYPAVGALSVLGITDTPAGSRIVLDRPTYVNGLPSSVQTLDRNSLVMIRTNGNRARIGNIYRTTVDVEGFAVSAFQIAMRPLDPTVQAYLYWYLGSPRVQEAITANASGSTGLGNVAVSWLKTIEIPVLDSSARALYIGLCEAADKALDGAEVELTRLVNLRKSLLDVLLTGEHQIPESYDELLEV